MKAGLKGILPENSRFWYYLFLVSLFYEMSMVSLNSRFRHDINVSIYEWVNVVVRSNFRWP